jgi:hypothetical protein
LKIDTAFLYLPVEEWNGYDSYNSACKFIKNVNVVNDRAERGVRLAADFLNRAQFEDRFQNVLQVVENDRKLLQDQRKRGNSNKETWFLHISIRR